MRKIRKSREGAAFQDGVDLRESAASMPYSHLADNIKMILIFLVVFNHLIAFRLVKADINVRYIWYGITIFHMPAFIFVSGYLSKNTQNATKNVIHLLIPYVLGYTMTWYAHIWLGKNMDYELLRPSGTAMWYLMALLAYRLTIEAFGKIRFVVPLSIVFALWAGTRAEFSTYLSASRIVVFYPFFVAGYLWKNEYTLAVRKFKGRWVFILISAILLYLVPHCMISNEMPVDIFRGNHSYLVSGLTNPQGIVIRLLMYLVSFVVIFTLFSLVPQRKSIFSFIGRNTMPVYFFHYPIMIVMNGLHILELPRFQNLGTLALVSLIFVFVLGNPVTGWIYNGVLDTLTFLLFKKDKEEKERVFLPDEDDKEEEEDYQEILEKRKAAIAELAAEEDEELPREQEEDCQEDDRDWGEEDYGQPDDMFEDGSEEYHRELDYDSQSGEWEESRLSGNWLDEEDISDAMGTDNSAWLDEPGGLEFPRWLQRSEKKER